MIRRFIHRQLERFEREHDCDMAYAHDIVETSLPAMLRFLRFMAMADHREALPLDAWFVAKLTATLSEDCGSCAQLVVRMAERAGVPAETLSAVAHRKPDAMRPDAELAWRFTRAALSYAPETDALRLKVAERWGTKAIVSLAFAITSARVFPLLKHCLGHRRACTRLSIGGALTSVHA